MLRATAFDILNQITGYIFKKKQSITARDLVNQLEFYKKWAESKDEDSIKCECGKGYSGKYMICCDVCFGW